MRLKRKRQCDEGSRALWSIFHRAELNACCHAMRVAKKQWDLTWFSVSWQGREIQRVEINFCPECGRKL